MQDSLKLILDIQELDVKMIRLMRVKKEREDELRQVSAIKTDLARQHEEKQKQVMELKKDMRLCESQITEIQDRVKRLEQQQDNVKKVDEYNALSHEVASAEREKSVLELRLSDLTDTVVAEEEILENIRKSLTSTEESLKTLEKEISESVIGINEEGRVLQKEREDMAKGASPQLLSIYERLLKNKRDRVVVPIEKRTCSGCHIVLTAQHENLVRKGEKIVFCEHCSRILYWPERDDSAQASDVSTARRRRRKGQEAAV